MLRNVTIVSDGQSLPGPVARARSSELPCTGGAPPAWMVRGGWRRASFPARVLAQAAPVAEQVWPAVIVFTIVAALSFAVAFVR